MKRDTKDKLVGIGIAVVVLVIAMSFTFIYLNVIPGECIFIRCFGVVEVHR